MYVPAVTPGLHCYNHKCSSNIVSDIFREEVQYTSSLTPQRAFGTIIIVLCVNGWNSFQAYCRSLVSIPDCLGARLVCKYEHSCASTGQMIWAKHFTPLRAWMKMMMKKTRLDFFFFVRKWFNIWNGKKKHNFLVILGYRQPVWRTSLCGFRLAGEKSTFLTLASI